MEKICEVNVEDIVIEDVEEADNELQVKVCVKYNYSWGTRNPEDTCNVSAIYSEAFFTPRMGQAIMNRLLKAAGHKIINVEEEKENDSTGM